ncbi:hypothetical protein [Halarchaeum sp. P4]|uniref:hypothetical protein n=1 Tax=Halarchaeum sp. P4 TaxID=3421639 RepID=UPI003EBE3F70
MMNKLREAVRHPYAAATSAFAIFGALLHPAAAEAFLWALLGNAGHIFTAATIGGFTMPRVFPSLAFVKPFLIPVIAISGVAYAARLAYTVYQDMNKEL